MKAMNDWKPAINPGYTGRRYYDDAHKTNGWFTLIAISFVVGCMLGATLGMIV